MPWVGYLYLVEMEEAMLLHRGELIMLNYETCIHILYSEYGRMQSRIFRLLSCHRGEKYRLMYINYAFFYA